MPSEKQIRAAFTLIQNDKSKLLSLTIGDKENVQPGTWLSRNVAQNPPKLAFSGANPTSTYLVVSLDIDAPFTAFNFLGPILHWIQSDIKVTGEAALQYDAPFIANYIGPAPPPVGGPHRYLFFLYEQPEGFDLKAHAPAGGKKLGNVGRMRYDLDAWAKEVKLGPVVAFNYFTSN
ncbi:Protease inhibitor (Tfs1) [Penicillium paradoxum]|uniref:Protease inhibitor (Tfs1) n=1 Tax=Penicillium paradoxum TaxID=176176 RepID=UPI002546F94A|nr:Protease inhibitor (Tfs1) [Penicillium paradoxum]KAJ5795054.1 Protease inhibitor (Tfs1) [Penicillium paradoxum]